MGKKLTLPFTLKNISQFQMYYSKKNIFTVLHCTFNHKVKCICRYGYIFISI